MVGQHSTLSAGRVQWRTRRQPPGATNEERGRARFPFTIMQSCSRPASDRCRGGQPLEATNEVRGRARLPSTTTQSCIRPARDDCRETRGGPWVSDTSALLHPTLIARGAQGGPERGARSSMISQACSHAADQPVITTGEACRWKLPTRSAAERGFLLQLLSHAADQPAMTAGARGGGPWVNSTCPLLHSTWISMGGAGEDEDQMPAACSYQRGARSSNFLLQVCNHAVDQPGRGAGGTRRLPPGATNKVRGRASFYKCLVM